MDLIGYFILVFYFFILIVIGVVCSRKQDSLSSFFLAGRSIPAWAALAAVVATETSAVTFLGAPAISFRQGGDLSFLQVAFGYIIARVILSLYFLPRFFENEIVTIYQFVGGRFGPATQKVSGIFFFITRALAAGVRHYAAALVLSVITNVDLVTAIVLTGLLSLAYSYLGGISAVIWTEVVQLVVMIVGGVLVFVSLYQHIPGGWSEIAAIARQNDKFLLFHWFTSPEGAYSFGIGVLGGFCLSLASHGADQDMVQRLLSCRSLRSAQIAIVGSGIFIFFQFALFLTIGILLFVYYGVLPEDIEKADQLLPYYAWTNMGSVASAIVIAAILSAALSSTASALNSLSSTSVSDFVLAVRKTPLDNRSLVRISRMFTLFWTVVLVGIAILASSSNNILDTGLSIPGYTYGSLLAAFLLGIFTFFRSEAAIIIGMIQGVEAVLILSLLGYDWPWFVPTGTATTVLAAYGVDWIILKCKSEEHQ